MLYVFQVDTGQMLHFDMDIAISTVKNLKEHVCEKQNINVDKQVLLVSGGEILGDSSRVCDYAAGTDTNPIFLFNKHNIENPNAHVDEHVSSSELESLQRTLESVQTLPATYSSVVQRANLATKFSDLGNHISRKCEEIIHHQHLQHQGWAAVVANLDDIVNAFHTKVNNFTELYNKFFNEYPIDKARMFIQELPVVLDELSSLKTPNDDGSSVLSWLSNAYSSSSGLCNIHEYMSSVCKATEQTYGNLTTELLKTIKQESCALIEKACSQNMKEIGGLESRLYGLDQLLQESKKLVCDQQELCVSINQNVTRANELRESSIYEHLSASHQHQLLVMLKNHSQIEDIKRRCVRAKDELTVNLNTRLHWISILQKNLSEQSSKLNLYNNYLKRLRFNVVLLQQIHTCGDAYNAYVVESKVRDSVNRQLTLLVSHMVAYNDLIDSENSRRSNFAAAHGNHFLSSLFDHMTCTQLHKVTIPVDFPVGPLPLVDLHSTIESQKATIESQTASISKLTSQVTELKTLIDEFREKEETQIRDSTNLASHHSAQIQTIEEKCQNRVIETTRMLEFEHSTKMKQLESSHKLELEALLHRFKLMNKSSVELVKKPEEDTNDVAVETAVDATVIEQSYEFTIPANVVSMASKYASRVNVSSCRVGGENSLFYYNEKFNAYTVYLESKSNNVHFLNSTVDEKPDNHSMFIGLVTDKEFCVARRAQNRYNVPQGFHFYRVKCKIISVLGS